jgi:hypothetical protein
MRLEVLGVLSIALGLIGLVLYFVPSLRSVAWVFALPGLLISWLDIALHVSRLRYAIVGMTLSLIAFSFCLAAMLWGSAA